MDGQKINDSIENDSRFSWLDLKKWLPSDILIREKNENQTEHDIFSQNGLI